MPIYKLGQVKDASVLSAKAESDYESDGGSHYSPKDILGEGQYARARRFESRDGKAVVVLDSAPDTYVHAPEIFRKHYFFANHYPERKSYLLRELYSHDGQKNSSRPYRMVVPCIPGVTYRSYVQAVGKIKDIEQQIHLFLSLVVELKALHDRGLIYLDFKDDNVLYDASTGKSHLIDGGLSVFPGQVLPGAFRLENMGLLPEQTKKHGFVAPECWTVSPSPRAVAHPSMDVFSLGFFLRNKLFEVDLDLDILCLTRACRLLNASHRPTLNYLSEALNTLLSQKMYRGYVPFMRSIANDKTDPLYCVIQRVAQDFLLHDVICSYDRENNNVKNNYSLEALPELEQYLFLEISGHILFSYLETGRVFELKLPDSYIVSMEAEILTIRFTIAQRAEYSEGNTEISTNNIAAKKNWKINKVACECAFSSLTRMNSKLGSFIYDRNDPVASALMLWRQLNEPVVNRHYHGYRPYAQTVENHETDPLLVLIKDIAQNFLLNKVIRSKHFDDTQEKSDDLLLQRFSELEQHLFLEIAGHVLISYLQNGKLSELKLPEFYQIVMEEDTLTIRNRIGQRLEFDENGTLENVDVFCNTSWEMDKAGCECAFTRLFREIPKLQHYIYDINAPILGALELWTALTEDNSQCYDSPCLIC